MSSPDDQAPQQPEQVASAEVEFDEENGTFRAELDFRDRSLSVAVTEAVATVADSDPVDLPPIHSVTDPDALDALFAPTVAGRPRGDGTVAFDLDGHRVTVHSYGIIEVEPVGDEAG